jgi:hypothetical protein
MNVKKMNDTLRNAGILIPVDELMELLEQHNRDQIDEVDFQKKAAELIVEWAAKESSLKTSTRRERVFDTETGTYLGDEISAVGQVLVDVVEKPHAEWTPSKLK